MIAIALWPDDGFETSGRFQPRFVAEARIGLVGTATHELDIGVSTAGPFGPAQLAQFPWVNGQPEAFVLVHDPTIPGQTFTVAAIPVQCGIAVAAPPLNALFLRLRAANAGTAIRASHLRVTSAGIASPLLPIPQPGGGPGPADVTVTNAGGGLASIQVGGAALVGGFELHGTLTLSWTGARPSNSALAFQAKAGRWSGAPLPRHDFAEELRRRRRWPSLGPSLLHLLLDAGRGDAPERAGAEDLP